MIAILFMFLLERNLTDITGYIHKNEVALVARLHLSIQSQLKTTMLEIIHLNLNVLAIF